MLSDQGGHVGPFTGDVQLDPVDPLDVVAHHAVAADRQGVRAQGGERLDRGLDDDGTRDHVPVAGGDLQTQGVHPGGLQPQPRPRVQVAT